MSFLQKMVLGLAPRKWAAGVEAESRAWMARCPCGFVASFWDLGGIRWKAAGNDFRYLHCPHCGKSTWHAVFKGRPAGRLRVVCVRPR